MVHLSMGVSDMKKFLINIAIFFAIVAVVDFSLAKVFHCIQARAGGRTGAEYYVCEEATEDIIIMGSSRASHHYIPEIISEKLRKSCFNAGQDGNGIILQYGRWKKLSERYSPKLVIYDITSAFDLAVNDNMTYVDRLKPFCRDATVRDYVSSIFPMERFKTLSGMYCYNYKFIEMVFDRVRRGNYKNTGGYIPLYGHIRREVVEKVQSEKESFIPTDPIKLYYLEKMIKEAKGKGTNIVLVVSPTWKGGPYAVKAYSAIKSMADRYGILFIEYIDSEICNNPEFYEDSSHLNDKGAREFSNDLFSKIYWQK